MNELEEDPLTKEEKHEEEALEIKILRSFLVSNSCPKDEVSTYNGILNIEDVVDWISDM